MNVPHEYCKRSGPVYVGGGEGGGQYGLLVIPWVNPQLQGTGFDSECLQSACRLPHPHLLIDDMHHHHHHVTLLRSFGSKPLLHG